MATHLTNDSPNPASAPNLPATVLVIHNDTNKPTQLNRNETKT